MTTKTPKTENREKHKLSERIHAVVQWDPAGVDMETYFMLHVS